MAKKITRIESALKRADVDELVKIVSKLDNSGRDIILGGISTELTDLKKKKLIEQIKLSAIETDEKVKEWLKNGIPEMYINGMNEANVSLAKYGVKIGKEKLTIEVLKGSTEMSPHLAAVNSLLSDAYLDFGNSMTGYVRGAEHIFNDTIKKQIQQKLSIGRLDGSSIKEISKIIKEDLGNRGFTVLLDKGGHSWKLQNYSEMLARTHLIKANNEATINRALDFDIDIVEISDHSTECKICMQYEGKIFSISGKSNKYPKLDLQAPYHPNCLHSIMPRPDLDE
ncbi:MAG: hypothetical protein P1P85_04225 [Patescibacteria group bacterium]|nr:hypothetical protein [Patescibacteria group bacterium]